MKLIVSTQYHENYEFDADGMYAVPGYWKAKGGTEYVVARGLDSVASIAELQALVEAKLPKMVWDNPASRSTIIDWYIIGEDELTQWEKDQLEFEGSITSFSPDLSVAA